MEGKETPNNLQKRAFCKKKDSKEVSPRPLAKAPETFKSKKTL
jgi:hypothetical protein